MNHAHSDLSPTQFRSRNWVLHQATEQELLDYLHRLLLAQRAQQEELLALVQSIVEEQHVMREEMEQVAMETWVAENTPPRTPWVGLGLAGLAGYLLGRNRD